MTLRVSDWQSASDLGSIRNFCDASALVQEGDISNLISVLIFDKNVMSQGRVEETPKIFGSLTVNTSSEKLNSIDRLQNSISNSTLLSMYGDLDNQCRDKMNNDKDCQGGQLTTSTNNILIRNTGFCVFRMKKIRSCSTWTRDSDDYFLNMPISVNNETWFQVDKTSLNIHSLTVQLLLGLEWCYSDRWKNQLKTFVDDDSTGDCVNVVKFATKSNWFYLVAKFATFIQVASNFIILQMVTDLGFI